MYVKKCDGMILNGKRKGESCNKSCTYPDTKCKIHINSNKKNKTNKKQKKNCCNTILKSGKRIGEQCNAKLFNDNMCKRHYNLSQKSK